MAIKGSCHCKETEVRGEYGAGKRHALHLFLLLQARVAVGVL